MFDGLNVFSNERTKLIVCDDVIHAKSLCDALELNAHEWTFVVWSTPLLGYRFDKIMTFSKVGMQSAYSRHRIHEYLNRLSTSLKPEGKMYYL